MTRWRSAPPCGTFSSSCWLCMVLSASGAESHCPFVQFCLDAIDEACVGVERVTLQAEEFAEAPCSVELRSRRSVGFLYTSVDGGVGFLYKGRSEERRVGKEC